MTKSVAPTAARVREFFTADEKRMSRLSEAGQANVQATRGRLSAEVVETFNKGRRNKYVPGSALAATKARAQANSERRAALRAKGVEVSDKGRIPTKA